MSDHMSTKHDVMAWADRGNCSGVDPEIFFPHRGDSVDLARAVCRGCAVSSECLSYAIDTNQRFGVWGGLTPAQRRRLARRHDHARRPVAAASVAAASAAAAPGAGEGRRRHLQLVVG
jgi:WhiB family redox-sensing transcriptional regulator